MKIGTTKALSHEDWIPDRSRHSDGADDMKAPGGQTDGCASSVMRTRRNAAAVRFVRRSSPEPRTCSSDIGPGSSYPPPPPPPPPHISPGDVTFRRRATAYLFVLASTLLLNLLTVPPVALAQATPTIVKLVGNTGKMTRLISSDFSDRATSFTTGGNALGYKLTAVDVHFDVMSSGDLPTYTMEIWSDSNGSPGSRQHTLTNPNTISSGSNTFSASNGGIDLDANKTYHVVWNVSQRGASLRMRIISVNDKGEDPAKAEGWSIANSGHTRHHSTTGNGGWNRNSTYVIKMAVHGYAKLLQAPAKPTGLTAAPGDLFVVIGGTAVVSDAVERGFVCYTTTSPVVRNGACQGSTINQPITVGNDGSFFIAVGGDGSTTLTNDTLYHFAVRLRNNIGVGPWSDEISGTPTAAGASLSALVVTDGTGTNPQTLTPTFDAETTAYTVRVVNAIQNLRVTATVKDSGAELALSMQRPDDTIQSITNPTSGTAATFNNLQPGRNRIAITVVSAAGNIRDYAVVVIREGPPLVTTDPEGPSLHIGPNTNLEITGMADDPDGNPSTFTWLWTAFDSNGNDISTTVLTNASSQTVTFNHDTLGVYPVRLTVTDDEGQSNEKALTVNVSTPDATLSALSATKADTGSTPLTLDPATFSSTTYAYTTRLGNGESTAKVTATVTEANTTMEGVLERADDTAEFVTMTSGTAVDLTDLVDGHNVLTITGRASDLRTTQAYTLTLTVPAIPEATIAPSGDQTVVVDTALVLTATAEDPDGGTVTYAWSATDSNGNPASVFEGATNAATATFNHDTPGVYTVRLIVEDDENVSISEELDVTVVPAAMVTLTVTPPTIAEGGSTTVTARLDQTVATATTVTVSAAAGTNTTTADFTLSANTTLTIPANTLTSTGTVTIAAEEDDVDTAGDKTVIVSGTVSGLPNPSDVTLTITDSDVAAITLQLTPASIPENGGRTEVSAWLTVATTAATTVTITASPGAGTAFALTGATLTIPAQETGSSTNAVITATDDTVHTGHKRVTVSATATGGVTTAPDNVILTITDDEAPPQGVSITPVTLSVEEGLTGTYTIVLTGQPGGAVTVTPMSDDPEVATVSGPLTFTPATWETPQTVTVTGVENAIDHPTDLQTTLTHTAAGGGYENVSAPTGTVTVLDNDVAGVTLSMTTLEVDEGGTGTYTVVLDSQPMGDVTVTPESSNDMVATVSGPLTFTPATWETPQTVTVAGVDDGMETEDGEPQTRPATLTHTLTGGGYDAVEVADVAVTVRDNIRKKIIERVSRVGTMVLPQTLRVSMTGMVDAIGDRLGLDGPAQSGTPQGLLRSLLGGSAAQTDDPWAAADPRQTNGRLRGPLQPQSQQPGNLSLSGQRFAIPLGGVGSASSLWVSSHYQQMSATDPGVLKFAGEQRGVQVGVDQQLGRGLTAGLAVGWNESTSDYTDFADDAEGVKGTLEHQMVGLYPYLGWRDPGRASAWGMLGYGWGRMGIADTGGGLDQRQRSDTDHFSAAVGGRYRLHTHEASATSVDLKAEAWTARLGVEGNNDLISGATLTAHRVRLAAEGARTWAMSDTVTLTPSLGLGVRNDSGDGLVTGTGFELNVGGAYIDQALGLEVDLDVRRLLTYVADGHVTDVDEWGVSGGIRLRPNADGSGLSFELTHAWGQTGGGVQQLWQNGAPQGVAGQGLPGGQLATRLGYGVPALDGLLTPYVQASRQGAMDVYRVGTSWARGTLDLDLAPWGLDRVAGTRWVQGTVALDLTGGRRGAATGPSQYDAALQLRLTLGGGNSFLP